MDDNQMNIIGKGMQIRADIDSRLYHNDIPHTFRGDEMAKADDKIEENFEHLRETEPQSIFEYDCDT